MQAVQYLSRVFCVAVLALVVQSNPYFAQSSAKCAEPQVTTDSKYNPGQIWSYRTRSGEDASTITILRVETLPKIGTIIHVRIDGIVLKNCSGGFSPHVIEHAPFSKDAVDRSVFRLVGQKETLPDYEAGYSDWRAHCGGVYTITIAQMLSVDEQTFNSGMNCQ